MSTLRGVRAVHKFVHIGYEWKGGKGGTESLQELTAGAEKTSIMGRHSTSPVYIILNVKGYQPCWGGWWPWLHHGVTNRRRSHHCLSPVALQSRPPSLLNPSGLLTVGVINMHNSTTGSPGPLLRVMFSTKNSSKVDQGRQWFLYQWVPNFFFSNLHISNKVGNIR